jgi:DHA2 family multidrug resistance protein
VTRHNPWAVAMTVTLATFMEVLDTSIANVSLPHIAGNLSEGTDAATWILTSYLVANAIVLPLSGWLSGLIGRKRFYMTCVALFTGSSLLCGLAPSLGWLIVFRLLQGLGGGGLQPSEQAILADTFPEEKRGMAFAVYGMAVVLAPAIGPTLGGFITDTTSWRWIFFINVPVGIASLFLTSRLVEDPPLEKRADFRIDYVGLGLIVTGIGCLQILLDKGEREDWFSSGLIVFLAVAAGVCILCMIVWEWRHPHPILELKLLASRNLGTSFAMMFVLGFVLYGTTVILPLFLQTLMGYTAMKAGEVLSPGGVVVILLLPLVGMLLGKIEARWLIGVGFLVTGLAMLHMTGMSLDIDFRTAVLYRIYQSIGLAFLFVPINTIAYVGVAPGKNNQVSALLNLARNIGGSIGISLATTLITRRTQLHRARLIPHVTPFDAAARAALESATRLFQSRGYADALQRAWAQIDGAVSRQAATLAYIDVIGAMAVIALAMLPLTFLLRRSKGAAIAH